MESTGTADEAWSVAIPKACVSQWEVAVSHWHWALSTWLGIFHTPVVACRITGNQQGIENND